MNNAFKKLCQKISYDLNEDFKNTKIISVILKEKKEGLNYFVIKFQNNEIIQPSSMLAFLEKLNNNFGYKTFFEFEIENLIYEKNIIEKYIEIILLNFFSNKLLLNFFKNLDKKLVDKNFVIQFKDNITYSKFLLFEEKINNLIKRFGFKDLKIILELKNLSDSLLEDEKSKIKEQAIVAIEKESDNEPQSENIFKKRGFVQTKIADLAEQGLENVIISGLIFKNVEQETKNGWTITTLSITDYSDAIYVKIFSKNEAEKEKNRKYIVGKFVEVSGKYRIDPYSQQPSISANKIIMFKNSDKDEKIDFATKKRVELSTRTKMSAMDGVKTPHDYVKLAKKWGHKTIAILDEDSVQSFPEFYFASKEYGIKPIYGVSLNTVEKKNNAIYWPKNNNLEKDSYVVFDLETTGLSPEYEEIIEFGAVKVKNNRIVDRKQFFVRPSKKIPFHIIKMTNITNEQILKSNAKIESEAILDIKNYLEGYTLVAHNANFDITFVNTKLEKYGYKKLNQPTIDTMVIARMVFPEAKRFRLQNIANRLNIEYDSEIAHRADYDAEVLARIWIQMIILLRKNNVLDQEKLTKFENDTVKANKFSKEVSLIAKNQQGLKELFQFVSLGLTDNFFKSPKVYLETLENRENVLLGSGALKSRLVDKMLFSSKDVVAKEISRYDYIEIQPLKNFSHIIKRGFKKEDLIDMIKFVINESKKQGKIIVATGDVRYLDEKEKVYHNVFINAKGLGGVRHYLYKYEEESPDYPIQNILTTNEMIEEFNFLDDINLIHEIVIENTNKIANMIDDNIQVIKSELYTPKLKDSDQNLKELVYKNAQKKYGQNLQPIIKNRIEKELKSIIQHGYAVIYWISHKLVSKSLNDGYLVGSRGSVGSSFVATMAEITEVNPLEAHYVCSNCKKTIFPENSSKINSGYDLKEKKCDNCNIYFDREGQNIPFETFLGFEGDKIPDIDLNFSGDYQPIIHNEVKKIFGENHVFRAGTISTIAEKMAFGYVKSWAENNNKNLSKPFIEFIAEGVTGTKRTTGQHPGGIIVIPKEFKVEDFTPINFPANNSNSSWKTTHFDFHSIHDNVLKLDLLGHDDPTVIKKLEEFTGINAKKDIPFFDLKVISLFSSTKELGIKPEDINGEKTGAMGIPEFGTKFVRGMLKKVEVKKFGDLISLSGLSHGTGVWTGNAENIIKEKNLTLDSVISCRDDIMIDLINKDIKPLFAFQIMEKVRKGQGITLEEEKTLREKGVDDWYINSIKNIQYMFPKAHATAYVMMAWRIAWFKLYYPLAYYSTYFTTRPDVFDLKTILKGKEEIQIKLSDLQKRKYLSFGEKQLSAKESALIPIFEICLEALSRGVKISNVHLKKSKAINWYYEKENNLLIPPFTTIDGLGELVAKKIILARNKSPFTSIQDLKQRTSINNTLLNFFEETGITKDLSKTNQIPLF